MFHHEVCRGRSTDKNNLHLPQPKKRGITAMFRADLSARISTFKSENIDDRKQARYDLRKSIKATPNDNIKTKLKNNLRLTKQEACGRESITSQVLKGINQLMWTLPPLYRTSLIICMLFSRLTTCPHRKRSLGCCRRGECTLHFRCGCNPILPMSGYLQGCGYRWHPRPCAPSMRIPTSRDFYRHLQPFPLSVCGSLMLQKIHYCAHTKAK